MVVMQERGWQFGELLPMCDLPHTGLLALSDSLPLDESPGKLPHPTGNGERGSFDGRRCEPDTESVHASLRPAHPYGCLSWSIQEPQRSPSDGIKHIEVPKLDA